MIIGAGGAGKSTLTRAICGCGAEEHRTVLVCRDHKSGLQVLEEVSYTLFQDGIAIAGNLKNGSDSISRMDALRQTVELCWRTWDIVIVDTVRSTHKFVHWLHEHPIAPAVLFVFVNLTLDANLVRLRGRRAARGIIESQLPPKTFWNVFSFRARARSVWQYARIHYQRQPVRFLEITEGTPDQAAERVWGALRELQQESYEPSGRSRTA
jgi:energy-coupling factor transporter ATP-binding protein EcfA2